ncbi:MAG: nucleoside-diphosphate sugar epimerase/dehydratase [Bowdeniella nasicola]|nr:nucleoside-diphosphate sugar epimerase/dehydratase [Bowdeniella nasicola]
MKSKQRLERILWDCASWIAAIVFVAIVRYNNSEQELYIRPLVMYTVLALAFQVVTSVILSKRYRTATFEEAVALTEWVFVLSVVNGTAVWLSAAWMFQVPGRPLVVLAVAPVVALFFMLAGRALHREMAQRGSPQRERQDNMLIVGAGDAGSQLYRLLRTDHDSPYRVVGFIDDAPDKANLRLGGVRVLGSSDALEALVNEHDVKYVTLAISKASPRFIKRLAARCEQIGITLLALPPLSTMHGGRAALSDIKEVSIADLLGRRAVSTDLGEVSTLLTGKRVLVVGAGGSIGSEISRQVHQFGPEELILLDRDESALHAVQLDIYHQGLLNTRDMVLCDIRDKAALERIFAEHRPHVVFHTAALKHLPMLELYPEEAWKTNVLGTLNLLQLAHSYGVETFVNISTDKAADPTTVLGRSKRAGEQLTAWMAAQTPDATFCSVRFGNVLGSRGSMLWTFQHQIDCGGPVTITHPKVERYFMTIPEACQLVLQAAAIGRGGDVMVLDMGEPVRILDVAKNLIRRSGKPIEIVFTGLRPGEKLSEVLVGTAETGERPHHPLISHMTVMPLAPEMVATVHDEVVAPNQVLEA